MTRLLIDTNVVVWLLLSDREQVSTKAVETLEDEANEVLLSAAVYWEIAIKRSLGKLRIDDGWATSLARFGFDPLPITAAHASAVEQLAWHHRDPFDRLLIAQSLVERCTFVTADRKATAYASDVLW